MSESGLKIYSPVITPRLEYVAETLFAAILGIEYEIFTELNKINGAPHIAYSEEYIAGAVCIKPSGLISERGVRLFEPSVKWVKDLPLLFASEQKDCFPFDIFSASFYMLSRYEEYLSFTPDLHGRFTATSSFAYRAGFLKLPVVDLWALLIAESLKEKFPEIMFNRNRYRALLTIDVDQAFAYKGRGFIRSVGGFVKDISLTGRQPSERLKTIAGIKDDPYDMFSYLGKQIEENNTEATFFFPVGNPGDHDHNPSHRDGNYISLIQRISLEHGCGIHNSYYSSRRDDVLAIETDRFSTITGTPPTKCRQHWLLLRIPSTYRSYISAGIKEDFTMGFADEPGFRAGIARPFRFYDIENEAVTGLMVIPFQFMDGTLRQYKAMSPESALKEIHDLIDVTKKVGGLFVSIWHNTSVAEMNGWEGWRSVFEETLRMQRQ